MTAHRGEEGPNGRAPHIDEVLAPGGKERDEALLKGLQAYRGGRCVTGESRTITKGSRMHRMTVQEVAIQAGRVLYLYMWYTVFMMLNILLRLLPEMKEDDVAEEVTPTHSKSVAECVVCKKEKTLNENDVWKEKVEKRTAGIN
eukprot:GHVU01199093.1.p1 GENE.GHVU01199093.1~~GHVU01199093.1.p1  ORF type:complete len:153 (+),score=23.85 GHVU01199093.1:29-460(+)